MSRGEETAMATAARAQVFVSGELVCGIQSKKDLRQNDYNNYEYDKTNEIKCAARSFYRRRCMVSPRRIVEEAHG
jgi:hypothetical protein